MCSNASVIFIKIKYALERLYLFSQGQDAKGSAVISGQKRLISCQRQIEF